MSLADYYSDSYPPELWETPAAPVAAARQSATDEGGTVPTGTVPPLPAAEDVQVSDQETVPGDALTDAVDDVQDDAVELPAGLTATAGTPGTYSPELPAGRRPRNVSDLVERGCTPDPIIPWAPGQSVPVGPRGKRAHWDGETWRSGEAPPFQTRARR